jgi:hypothetical protein
MLTALGTATIPFGNHNYENCNLSVGKSAVNGCNSFAIARLLMTINVYCQDGDMLAVVPLVLVIIFPWLAILSHDSSPPKDRRVICPLQHRQYRILLLIFLFFPVAKNIGMGQDL